MYTHNVEIIVNGEKIIVKINCEPYMPEEKLKELAIKHYLAGERRKLFKENGLEY